VRLVREVGQQVRGDLADQLVGDRRARRQRGAGAVGGGEVAGGHAPGRVLDPGVVGAEQVTDQPQDSARGLTAACPDHA
jgi:hypothetical protein